MPKKTGAQRAALAVIAALIAAAPLPCLAEKSEPPKVAAKPSEADKSSGAAAPALAVGESADKLLRDMSEYMKAAKEFSFHAEIIYDDLLPSGQKLLFAAAHDVAVRRPDRLYSDYRGEGGSKRLWYDGKNVTLFDPTHNAYATEKAPASIDATLDFLIGQLGFTPPLSDLLYGDPHSVLRRSTVYGFDVGPSEVSGAHCRHLAFVEDTVDWQIWIDTGILRVPRKLAITYKTLPGAPQFIAVISDWDFVNRLPDSLFAPEVPPGAGRIEFLKAAAKPEAKPDTRQSPPSVRGR